MSVEVSRPDAGWPLVITISCGGYVDPLIIVAECETVSWRTVETGRRLGAVIAAWLEDGGLGAVAEMGRQSQLSDAHRGRS